MKSFLPLVARILICQIFIISGVSKISGWQATAAMMAAKGIPAVPLFLAVTVFVEIVIAICLLIGFRARVAALLLFLWLVPVTVTMHNFWASPAAQQLGQLVNFQKNLAIMGGLLMVGVFGPGSLSLNSRQQNE
jgi:putative oxidoreductase